MLIEPLTPKPETKLFDIETIVVLHFFFSLVMSGVNLFASRLFQSMSIVIFHQYTYKVILSTKT